MQFLVDLACGTGYVVAWNAVSAIATTAAVVVALWIPARDRRLRRLEKLESEARAAEIVAQKLGAIIEVIPLVIDLVAKAEGMLVDNPGSEVLYGVDACKGLVEREAFCHQLPLAYIASGELVCSLARKWCSEIDVRRQTQRHPRAGENIGWRNHDFLRSLGELLHTEAVRLKAQCQSVQALSTLARAPLRRRALATLKSIMD
jgi:hypothetical protein